MNILVISLTRSAGRRQHITRQMARLGLEFEFVDAIDKLDLDAARLDELVAAGQITADAVAAMGAGTVACALSHRKALARSIEVPGEKALILEDDALLTDDVGSVLDRLDHHDLGRAVTLLYCRYPAIALSTLDAVPLTDSHQLYHSMRRHLHMAAAYCVTDASARSLLEATAPIVCPADVWSMHAKNGGFDRLLVVHPFPAGVAPVLSDRADLPSGPVARTYVRLTNGTVFPFSLATRWKQATKRRRLESVDLVAARGEFQQVDR